MNLDYFCVSWSVLKIMSVKIPDFLNIMELWGTRLLVLKAPKKLQFLFPEIVTQLLTIIQRYCCVQFHAGTFFFLSYNRAKGRVHLLKDERLSWAHLSYIANVTAKPSRTTFMFTSSSVTRLSSMSKQIKICGTSWVNWSSFLRRDIDAFRLYPYGWHLQLRANLQQNRLITTGS